MREAKNLVKFLVSKIFKFGVLEIIHSDKGNQFVAKEFHILIEVFGLPSSIIIILLSQTRSVGRI